MTSCISLSNCVILCLDLEYMHLMRGFPFDFYNPERFLRVCVSHVTAIVVYIETKNHFRPRCTRKTTFLHAK